MSAVRQIGIKMVVDAQSVTTEVPKAAREFDALGARAEQASARTTRSLAQVQLSVRDIVAGAAGLHVVSSAIRGITNAITALPGKAFDYSKELEVSKVGMAGILGSMTAINGQQTDYNAALRISSEMIRKLNDDALRTAATSQELSTVFQALLAPGLSAKMTLEEIRQLTVVGTNAVKSMGLQSTQVVQELRDLVAGGITPASSTLATALGLKDSDIAKARASSEGLFAFLMQRLKGFEASSEAFGDTFKGKLEQLQEGATRVAAEGMQPLIAASKQALGEVAGLFVTLDEHKNVSLNKELVADIRAYASAAAEAMAVGKEWAVTLWDNRDAAIALGAVWASIKLGRIVADTVAAVAAKAELAQASRLAAAQAAAEAGGNVEVVATSRQKLAAYLAELEAKAATARAEVTAQAAQLATLATTREAIVISRAEVVAKLDSVRTTMAQAEAQIAAARAAGAQSVALALLREGTQALTAAQARHALLMTELATLGKQQASVNAAVAAATAAQTAATNAATAAAGGLAAAQGAASVAGRALSGAVGFLGGPIGVVTTALTLGVTAWSLWGNAGSDAERKVQAQVARSTAEIVADLDKQIAKLGARNALAAAGMGELAKKGGEAAERLAALQVQINNLQSGKGVDGGAPLPEAARVDLLQKLLVQYGTLAGTVQRADEAQAKLDKGTGELTLTLTGSEQAWRKSIDGVKTATAAQQEYQTKLSASRQAWETFKGALVASGASAETIAKRQAEQAQVEKSLADERDKKIKEMGASAATAQAHSIDAQVAATKQGYKLLAAQTADGLAEIDSLRKQDLLSEAETLERRTALQLQDMDAQRGALQAELGLLKGKKDSAKEQATIIGELAELEQKRANLERQAARESREQEAQLLNALEQRIGAAQTAAAQAQENVRLARLDTQEIGQTGVALGALRQARVDEAAAQLEAQARTLDGIDLSGRAGDALRAQANAVRDLAKTSGYNEAAKMVSDYAKAIDEGNAATQFEQSLSMLSQRDRDIALEQYRIAVDLKTRIAEIDAKNPADAAAAAKLRADAEAAAARAKAGVAVRVNLSEWSKSVEQYDDIFRQGFADMLNRGEEGWKSFTKSLATTFKTTVADQLYKAFAQPVVVKVVASLLGVTGSSTLNAATGGSGALGAIQTASNINTLWGAGSQALYGGAAGASMASLGYANAVGMVGGDAIGALATANGMWAGVATGAQAAAQGAIAANLAIEAGAAAALPAGTAAAAAGSTAAAGGISGALGAIPGWGWAAAAVLAIGSLLSKPRTYHSGGAGSYSAEGGASTGLNVLDQGLTFGVRSKDYSRDAETSAVALSMGLVNMLNKTARSFGKDAGYYAATAFADDSSKDGAWGSLIIRRLDETVLDWADTQTSKWSPKVFADGEEGQKEYLAAVAVSARDAVVSAIADVGWANDMLTALGEAPSLEGLTQAVDKINAASFALGQMRKNLDGFDQLTDGAASSLVRASGGIDALVANASVYYDSLYSEEEKSADALRDVTDVLAALGLETPKTKSELRAMVAANVALGESGEPAVAALFGVSGALSELLDKANAARSALAGAVGTVAQSIASMRQNAERAGAGLDSAHTAIADAYAASTGRVADAQASLTGLMEQSSDATRSFAGTLTDYLASLRTGQQSGLDPATRKQMLAAELQSTAVLAQGGDAASRERLTGVASSYLDAARAMAGSDLEYAREVARVRSALEGVAASLPEAGAAGGAQTLEQQIADAQTAVAAAQAEQARYAQLAADTGTAIALSTDLVGDEIAALRTAYDAAAAEQAAANLRLDVALAALDTLGLSEGLVNALAAGQTGASGSDFAVALGVSDDVIAQLQGALALSDDDLAQLSAALNVSVAPQVYEALGQALGASPALVDTFAASLGASPIQMQALAGALGMDADTALALRAALGVDPATRQTWASALGVDTTQMLPLAAALGWDPEAATRLGSAIGLAQKTVEAMTAMQTLVGFSGDALATADALSEQIGISPFARGIIDSLAYSMGLGDDALAVINALSTSVGIDAGALGVFGQLGTAVGVQSSLLPALGQALGLSPSAAAAIAQLAGAAAGQSSTVEASVLRAYASIGRTGITDDISDTSKIDREGYDYWVRQLTTGATAASDFAQVFLQTAANYDGPNDYSAAQAKARALLVGQSLPKFDGGTSYVPFDMAAYIHAGEEITPRAYVDAQRSDREKANELLAGIQAEVRSLRTSVERHGAHLEAIKTSSGKTADTLTTVTRNGRAMQMELFV